MSESLATYHGQPLPEAIEMLLMGGDLSQLSAPQRIQYYMQTCQSLGLNPLTRPFDFLELDKKVVLYARKDATEQLRNIRGISIEIVGEKTLNSGIYVVTAKATMPDGRFDTSTGAVPLNKEDGQWKTSSNNKRFFEGNGKMIPLNGDALANAYMKAETKAKRRVTLSICGLGLLDESEIDSVAGARRVAVDMRTGEIQQDAKEVQQRTSHTVSDEKIQRTQSMAVKFAWSADELSILVSMYGFTTLNSMSAREIDALFADLQSEEVHKSVRLEIQNRSKLRSRLSDSSDAVSVGRGSVEDVMDGPSKQSVAGASVADERPDDSGVTDGSDLFCSEGEATELSNFAVKLGWTVGDWNRAMVEMGIPSEEQIPKQWYLRVKNFVASTKNLKRIRAEAEGVV